MGRCSLQACDPLCPAVCSDAHFHRKVLWGSLLAMVDATSDWWPLIRFINASRVLMPVSGGHSTTIVVLAGSGCSVSVRSSGPTCMGVPFVSAYVLCVGSCPIFMVLSRWRTMMGLGCRWSTIVSCSGDHLRTGNLSNWYTPLT